MLNQDQKISLVYKQILNGYEDVNLFALLIKYGLFFFEKNKLLCLKINNHEYFFKKEIFKKYTLMMKMCMKILNLMK